MLTLRISFFNILDPNILFEPERDSPQEPFFNEDHGKPGSRVVM